MPFHHILECRLPYTFDRYGHTVVNISNISRPIQKQTFPKWNPMNKLDLIQTLCTTNGISKVEAAKIVSIFFEQMATALANDDRVERTGGLITFKPMEAA